MGQEKKATMFDLRGQFLELLDMSMDPEADQEILQDTMDALAGEIEVKADDYAAVMRSLDNRIKMYKAEAKRLKDAADYMQANYDRMKQTIKETMEIMEVDELDGAYNHFKIVKNGGIQPLKITGDVPESYTKITIAPDNEKIRKALEAGEKLDFAYLEERGTHLSIK